MRRIANMYGCKVDEGSAHPCIINGHDYGEFLYSLGVMDWLLDCLFVIAFTARKSATQMRKWLNDNGPIIEEMLMDWNNMSVTSFTP